MRIPEGVKRIARPIRRELKAFAAIRKLRAHGIDIAQLAANAERRQPKSCPVCGHRGRFKAFGNPPRWDAQCPECDSLERHRLLALLLRQGILSKEQKILHFAPEPCVGKLLRPFARHYVTADICDPDADLKIDIEAINLPDQSFDVIACSHVLEHVDDEKALRELRRILKPGGTMLLAVPLVEAIPIYEDATITNPLDREIHFGQHDHVRVYGSDFRDRLKSAGLTFYEYSASGKDAIENGLIMGDRIFICRQG